MVFITEGFFEVAIESWPEWDLNPRPLNSVQKLQPTELSGHDFNLHSEPNLYSYSNFIFCSVSHFISAIAFVSVTFVFIEFFVEVITLLLLQKLILKTTIKCQYFGKKNCQEK